MLCFLGLVALPVFCAEVDEEAAGLEVVGSASELVVTGETMAISQSWKGSVSFFVDVEVLVAVCEVRFSCSDACCCSCCCCCSCNCCWACS